MFLKESKKKDFLEVLRLRNQLKVRNTSLDKKKFNKRTLCLLKI